MITTGEAKKLVLGTAKHLEFGEVPIKEAIGNVLAKDIYADRDFPPFDRVAMDGIAIHYASYLQGQRTFKSEGINPAGTAPHKLKNPTNCVEIMTGASLAIGCDTVIRYEDLDQEGDHFTINKPVKRGQNIHQKGSDHPLNDVLLHKFSRIKAIDINVLATVGCDPVPIVSLPKVAIVSTGNELVEINALPASYQIRKSNIYMLHAALKEYNIDVSLIHVQDNKKKIEDKLQELLANYDVILMSGGVSKGKFDFIPSIMEKLGIQKIFHKVAQRPGKPFWFGQGKKTTIFAFPGNPVSTLVCYQVYFVPWLLKSLGLDSNNTIPVTLENDVIFKPDLCYFAEAKLNISHKGQLSAQVIRGNGSGDMVNPTLMNGFLHLPKGSDTYRKGEVFSFIPYKSLL